MEGLSWVPLQQVYRGEVGHPLELEAVEFLPAEYLEQTAVRQFLLLGSFALPQLQVRLFLPV